MVSYFHTFVYIQVSSNNGVGKTQEVSSSGGIEDLYFVIGAGRNGLTVTKTEGCSIQPVKEENPTIIECNPTGGRGAPSYVKSATFHNQSGSE